MSDDALDRRLPRRLLLGGGVAAAALTAAELVRPSIAGAAPASTPWRLGGNADVTTDGSNWLGPTNVAPLVFKTRAATSEPTSTERMRITPAGQVGIGTAVPRARVDVLSNDRYSVRGTTRSRLTDAAGVAGVAGPEGAGVLGTGVKVGVAARATGTTPGSPSSAITAEAPANGTGLTATVGPGGYGVFASGGMYGVLGIGSMYGVLGQVDANAEVGVTGTGGKIGVRGANGTQSGVTGVGDANGVVAVGGFVGLNANADDATGVNYGVLASVQSPDGYAVYAQGNARVTGTLSKSAGSFRIDHPLDPTNRWLSHSFVESPDMMNVYNGNVVLGADGTATVELPDYFEALNRDFRYQLTCIGGHAPVYIAGKVAKGRFSIAGGTAGLEVSWQVTGIRKDDYAKEHPIVVDVPKTGKERGTRDFVPAGSTATPYLAAAPVAR